MTEVKNESEMRVFGEHLGRLLRGGEVIELIGDVGAGKTTMVRGIARGMGIDETVQSPSFTINRVYDTPDDRHLVHYDFYRLSDPGIMRDELEDTLRDTKTSVVIEWADSVESVLPDDKLIIAITSTAENERHIDIQAGGVKSAVLMDGLA